MTQNNFLVMQWLSFELNNVEFMDKQYREGPELIDERVLEELSRQGKTIMRHNYNEYVLYQDGKEISRLVLPVIF